MPRFKLPAIRGTFKGIESLPLKYIAMLLIAVVIVSAFIQITNMMSDTAMLTTQSANQTLLSVLDKTIGGSMVGNVTP